MRVLAEGLLFGGAVTCIMYITITYGQASGLGQVKRGHYLGTSLRKSSVDIELQNNITGNSMVWNLRIWSFRILSNLTVSKL